MAEANNKHEDITGDVKKEEQHQDADTAHRSNFEEDETDIGKRNHPNVKENSNEYKRTRDIPAEKHIVYRNFGAVKLKPLVLQKPSWSTKDIKERFSYPTSDKAGREHIGLGHGNYKAQDRNLFKRHNIQANATTTINHDAHAAKPLGLGKGHDYPHTGQKGDAADTNIEQGKDNFDIAVATENMDKNQTIGDATSDKATAYHNKDVLTKTGLVTRNTTENIKPYLAQNAGKLTDVVQRKYNTEVEYTNENINNNDSGQDQGLHNVAKENSNEIQGICDDSAEYATANGSDEAVTESPEENKNNIDAQESRDDNKENNVENENVTGNGEAVRESPEGNQSNIDTEENRDDYEENNSENATGNGEAVRESPEGNQSNIETEENRDDYEENNAEAAETSNGDRNTEEPQSGQNSQVGQQDEENEEDQTTDNTDEKKTEKEAWTQEEIQVLFRKAINLHAPEKDLKTIINCGGDVNKTIKSGLYPLHYAAYSDYPECIELLLNSGANVNVTDDIGYTPLHLAARRGNHRSMEVLIENGAIINYSEPGVEIHQSDERNKLGYTTMEPINLAVQNGNPRCARILLEKGARPNNKYFMGFEISLAPLDNPECMELLMEFGADPNVFNRCGMSPLMKACKDHHIEAVRRLIRYGADVNAICPPLFEQKSVLQYAIISGNIVIINILLGKGAKLARQGEYKYSALHTAVIKGRADICRLLLQHGVDVNERTDEGATAMMLACSTPDLKERRDIVQLLLDCGADINAHSPGYSYFDPYLAPLTEYFKCIENREGFSIVRLMIRNGAIIHLSSSGIDMEVKRARDPFSILPFVHCLQNNQQMFDFVVSAATKFSPLLIYATRNIPEDMKDSLIYTATRPRELKHLVRVSLRSQLTPDLPDKVQKLPLPPLLKSYLLFR